MFFLLLFVFFLILFIILGHFSVVNLVKHRQTGTVSAVKVFFSSSFSSSSFIVDAIIVNY